MICAVMRAPLKRVALFLSKAVPEGFCRIFAVFRRPRSRQRRPPVQNARASCAAPDGGLFRRFRPALALAVDGRHVDAEAYRRFGHIAAAQLDRALDRLTLE